MLGMWFLRSFGKRSEDATGANDEPFLVVAYSRLWLETERKPWILARERVRILTQAWFGVMV